MDVDSDEKLPESEEKAATSAKKKAEDSSEEKTSPVKAEKVKSEENKAPRTIQVDEFLVKFKNFSYLHCQWQTEAELLR
jgi:chromodomain-helicase-DNA-binding protein 7